MCLRWYLKLGFEAVRKGLMSLRQIQWQIYDSTTLLDDVEAADSSWFERKK